MIRKLLMRAGKAEGFLTPKEFFTEHLVHKHKSYQDFQKYLAERHNVNVSIWRLWVVIKQFDPWDGKDLYHKRSERIHAKARELGYQNLIDILRKWPGKLGDLSAALSDPDHTLSPQMVSNLRTSMGLRRKKFRKRQKKGKPINEQREVREARAF